jgi:hypothetical protein
MLRAGRLTVRATSLIVIVLLWACGEEPPAAPQTIRPEPAREETAEAPSKAPPARDTEEPVQVEAEPEEARAPAPPLPAPVPGRAHLFVLGDDSALFIDEEGLLDTEQLSRPNGREREVRFPHVQHPDVRVRRLLAERIAAFAVAHDNARTEDENRAMRRPPPDWEDGEGHTECGAALAMPTIVSVICVAHWTNSRNEGSTRTKFMTLAIEDGAVREIELAELFLPGTNALRTVIEAAEAQAEEDGEGGQLAIHPGARPEQVAFGIDNEGFVLAAAEAQNTDFDFEYIVPFDLLTDALLATGPLAESFVREDVTTRSVEVTDTPRQASGTPRWAVMPMASVSDLGAAWMSLAPEQRAVLRRAGSYLVAPDEAVARTIATALGTNAAQVLAPAEEATFVIVSTRHEVPMRSQPGGETDVRMLERGTLLVAPDDPGGATGERHLAVAAHGDLHGFVDRRQLELATCVPDLAPFLATLPEAARRSAALRTLRNSLSEGGWGRVTYITEIDGQSHVELRRLEEGCAVGRAIAHFTRPGRVTSLATTRTAARGGDSLIVTVTSEPSVSIHALGAAEPAWTRALSPGERVETSQREGDAWFPVVVVRPSGEPLRISWGESGPRVVVP